MSNVLVVLDRKTEINSLMLEDIVPLIKIKGTNVHYAFFVEIPLRLPIDSEDDLFQSEFQLAEHVAKSFNSNLNNQKISSSRISGGIYKVRDSLFGIIEKSLEQDAGVVVITELMYNKLSGQPNKNSKFGNITFRNEPGISKIISSSRSSIFIWKEKI